MEEINKYLIDNKINNISFLGFLNHEELVIELSSSDVGFIFYPLDKNNNIYCAPGKLHEYIFECLPIITSSNQTLSEFNRLHEVGVSNDDFSVAIKIIFENYEKYVHNIKMYLSKNKNLIFNNRNELIRAINNSINEWKMP